MNIGPCYFTISHAAPVITALVFTTTRTNSRKLLLSSLLHAIRLDTDAFPKRHSDLRVAQMSAGMTTNTTQESTRPTILLIPGAWFPSSAYNSFLHAVRNAGYQTECASYPSLNPKDPRNTDTTADTSFVIKNYLIPLIEIEQKDVVIVMHSYGGIPGSSAATGFGKAARQQRGRRGGVVGLVHSSGFVLPEGLSCADGQGGSLPPWIKENYVRLNRSNRSTNVGTDIAYSDSLCLA